METIQIVSHQQARQLFLNKSVVVLGSSVQRSIYKDIVLLLQKDQYLSNGQLKTKGEMSFEQDRLVEGGSLKPMDNGTGYRESVLNDFRSGLKPDVVIVNSCVWDISRYNSDWKKEYKNNLQRFLKELKEVVPKETIIIWNLAMPLGQNIRGGFLVPEIEHKTAQLRQDVIQANLLSGTLANSFGVDVLDLHYYFRHSLHHCSGDGIHWDALAHRCITSLLLQHIAQAWGVDMPCPMSTDESRASNSPFDGFSYEFVDDSLTFEYLSFNDELPQPLRCEAGSDTARPSSVSATPRQAKRRKVGALNKKKVWLTDLNSMPPEFYGPDYQWDYHYHHYHLHCLHSRRQRVLRNHLRRNHCAPYPHWCTFASLYY